MINQQGERSILYNLKPLGMGTKYVESLTSYIIRIAYEHNITVCDLMKNLIAPQMKKEYLIRSGTYGGNRFYEGAKTINGYMENSGDLVKALETLTSRKDLSILTLYKWRGGIPIRHLLKETFSWCPECINNMHSCSKVYYPLIWHLKTIKICKEHNRYLVEKCQLCCKRVDILRRQMVPGYCHNCLSLLSVTSRNDIPDSLQFKWQKFVIENIEDILISEDAFTTELSFRNQILNQLNIFNVEYFSGNISNFANFLNIPKSTLRYWLAYKKFPHTRKPTLNMFQIRYKNFGFAIRKRENKW